MTPTMGLLLGAALFVALFVYTFWPEQAVAAAPDRIRMNSLEERRTQLEENRRDLEFENAAGKYPQEDFERQRGALEAETAALEGEIAAQEKIERRG